jgi:hypothetical protein
VWRVDGSGFLLPNEASSPETISLRCYDSIVDLAYFVSKTRQLQPLKPVRLREAEAVILQIGRSEENRTTPAQLIVLRAVAISNCKLAT